jgi:hypothetical protein
LVVRCTHVTAASIRCGFKFRLQSQKQDSAAHIGQSSNNTKSRYPE